MTRFCVKETTGNVDYQIDDRRPDHISIEECFFLSRDIFSCYQPHITLICLLIKGSITTALSSLLSGLTSEQGRHYLK